MGYHSPDIEELEVAEGRDEPCRIVQLAHDRFHRLVPVLSLAVILLVRDAASGFEMIVQIDFRPSLGRCYSE